MGNIIGDMACPSCREKGRDATGNHLMIFSDGGGHCSRCGYSVKDVSAIEEGSVPTTINSSPSGLSLEDVGKFKVTKLPSRKISLETARKYGVRTSVDTSTGEINKHWYPITKEGKIVAYKARQLADKRFTTIGSAKGKVDFFGQSAMPKTGKKIMITAGEEDAMAAYEMLKRKYPDSNPIVVSVPKGENNAKTTVADQMDYLNGFEEILVYMDMDDAGQKAALEVCQLIGERARLVDTSEKDASDMYLKGKSKEFVSAFFSATPYVPDGFVSAASVFEEATKMPEWGRPWPWKSLNDMTYGRRDGEGIFVGAGVKIGKSEFLNQMIQHIIVNEKRKAATFKFEEKPAMTLRRVAGKVMKKPFHKPDGDFTQEELIEGVTKVGDSIVMFDSYMGSSSDNLWDRLKPAIRHAVLVEGCKDIFIDPITTLTDGMTPSDTDTELRRFSGELAALAKDLGFFYYCFVHLKAPQSGTPHEEGGRVHSNQFRGSRAMMEKAYFLLGIQRDKSPDNPEVVKNMSTFVLLEDRAFGNSGKFPVYYDIQTGSYLEPDMDTLDEYNGLVG